VKKKLSWAAYAASVKKLAAKIDAKKTENIYPASPQGAILAAKLSSQIKRPVTLDAKAITKKTLIVDNASYDGKQFKAILTKAKPKPATAVIHLHAESSHQPTHHVERLARGDSVRYPWQKSATDVFGNRKRDDEFDTRRHMIPHAQAERQHRMR